MSFAAAPDGARIFYSANSTVPPWRETRGTILMHHGVALNGDAWCEWEPVLLAAGYNVIRVDMRGFGRSTPLVSGANPAKPNSCGRIRRGVEVRLVDANDCSVATGEIGQMIIRSAAQWSMNHGYHNNSKATADAWRNGWFHTGDVFVRDADGDFRFVDRLKDTIRRRGENISSYEVEVELLSHRNVREAAAIAVPSELSEDEILAVVATVDGQPLDPAEIIAHLVPRMAHHMVPRYIRIVDGLPKTPTAKVEKHVLRAQGLTADTWDRERAGIKIRRTTFG